MLEVDEPLSAFAVARQIHGRLVSDHFEALVAASGIDEAQNAATVSELHSLEHDLAGQKKRLRNWRASQVIAVLSAIALTIWAFVGQGGYLALLAPAGGMLLALPQKVNPTIRAVKELVADISSRADAKRSEASTQMESLNGLHTWDVAQRLFQRALPHVEFDRYLSAQRLHDLERSYGLSPNFGDGRSMLAIQSGCITGNPFAFVRYLQHWIGTMTYSGSIVISWVERVRDSDGNWKDEQRTQTLTATVTKPFPFYMTRSALIFGHEAVPGLSFSRLPSRLSGLDENFVNNWRKERAVRSDERRARRAVKKGGGYTVMSNTEFESLFQATDRTDEIGFRLLFTALAQQEMVGLMNDRQVGYGDDFGFAKAGRINIVEPAHLSSVDLDADPRQFAALSVAEARQRFTGFNAEYFRSLYFAFAPLWTIPLYHDRRSIPDESAGVDPRITSAWDHEVVANRIGHDTFRHPDSVTTNMLKTAATVNNNGSSTVAVAAHGYRGIARVDMVPVYGGDGKWHQVPVHWTEYIAVERTSYMAVSAVLDRSIASDPFQDQPIPSDWGAALSGTGLTLSSTFMHRGVVVGIAN